MTYSRFKCRTLYSYYRIFIIHHMDSHLYIQTSICICIFFTSTTASSSNSAPNRRARHQTERLHHHRGCEQGPLQFCLDDRSEKLQVGSSLLSYRHMVNILVEIAQMTEYSLVFSSDHSSHRPCFIHPCNKLTHFPIQILVLYLLHGV
jgi:hypothetical protein